MIRKIITSFILFSVFASFAQESSSSPYSFYGIGDVKFKGTAETRSMGGVSVFADSIHLNLQNPAQLASLKITSFAVGGTYLNTKLTSETQKEKARRTTLDYLAIGIPTGKFAFGFGLIPYTAVGYKIQKLSTDSDPLTTRYNGSGGINKVFFGMAYKLTKNINIGIDGNYNFGTIETTSLRFLDAVQYGTRETNHSELSGFNINAGLAFQTKVKSKYTYFGSVVYSPVSDLTLQNEREIATVQFSSSGSTSVVDLQNIIVPDAKMKLPSKFSIGSGFGEVKKWLIGAEVTFQSNSDLKNRFDDINGVVFENSTRYSLGGYFIPNFNSYADYYKRITYRGGLRFENTGMVIQDKKIDDFAVNFGLGLPLGGTFSNININFEIGKRGTKYYNLIQENYFNLSLGFSLSDRWFVKRKYD